MNKNFSLDKLLFYFTLLFNVLFILQVFAGISGWNLDYFFNSDALYLPSIYKDVFVDNTGFEGWHLNAAPNFIPEWPVYFLIRFITGDFILADLVYSICYVVAVNLLTVVIIKTVFEKINYYFLALVNIGYALFLHQYLLQRDFINTAYLFFTGFHGGAFLMALLSFTFFFIYFKNGEKKYLIFLLITVFTGVLSDRLLIVFFVVPSLFIYFYIRDIKAKKRVYFLTAGNIIATILAIVSYNLIRAGGFFHIIGLGPNKEMNFSKIDTALVTYSTIITNLFQAGGIKSIIILISVLSVLVGLYLMFRYVIQNKSVFNERVLEKILITTFTAYIVIVTLTPIVHGTFKGLPHLRYNFSSFYVGISLFVIILYLLSRKKEYLLLPVKVLTIALIVLELFSLYNNHQNVNTFRGLERYMEYYPEKVKRIDNIAKENNLQYGVADYWLAKKTTMFSKQDLRVYTVNNKLHARFHVMNEHWYFRDNKGKYGNPAFNFIILNKLKPKGSFYQKLLMDSDTLTNKDINILKVDTFGYKNRTNLFMVNE